MKTTRSGKHARYSMRARARLGFTSSGLALLLASAPAWGEEPSAGDTAAARDLAIEGLKLADADHCAPAIEKLARAEKLRHSAIVLGRLGECRIQIGKIVEGTEDLQRMLHEPLPANPPANLLRARERAQAALDAAKPNLAYLAISVKGPTENITVTVDGQPMSALLLDRERPTDPGEHLVEASAPGYVKASRRLTIGVGERQEVTMKLAVDPQATTPSVAAPNKPQEEVSTEKQVSSTPAPLAPPTQQQPREPGASSTQTASYILMGAGAAVLAGGGVFGFLALDKKNSLDGKCPNGLCQPGTEGTLDSAKQYATVSTILVGTGAAAVALGSILYFTSGSSSSEEHPPVGFRARGYIGVGQAGFAGTF